MSEPRGIRNCNPGNIRLSKEKWQGLRKEQKDPSFFQFDSMIYGYRAMAVTLLTYQRKHKLNTVAEFISRWAPRNENHTSKYISFVAAKMDVDKDLQLDLNITEVLVKLCAAITIYENGVIPNEYDLRTGVHKALTR